MKEVELGERWRGHFGLEILVLANIDRNKLVGLKVKNAKF